MADIHDIPRDKCFTCGVCEGFYGEPWTAEQRVELYHRMKKMQMNTYMYAPKDDYKHRMFWRDLYTQEEADELKNLILAAKVNGITFVYAISPGIDITYTSNKDKGILKKKLKQVADLGCCAFAVLFDDIEDELCKADEVFDSFAHAQSDVTNEVYKYLNEPEVFLFCPTEYCTSRAVPDLPRSQYLQTLGDKLHANISILWTGPKVVPKRMTVEGIKEVQKLIKRKPVIWDNIHANDYDQTRLYLGPYDGRPVELQSHLGGVLTNPNCEFEANFIAMHTLAQWSLDTVTSFYKDGENSTGTRPNGYRPKLALRKAIEDWIPELYKSKGSTRCKAQTDIEKMMDTSETAIKKFKDNEIGRKKDKFEKPKIEDLPPLDIRDVQLLSDLFYLPFDHGAKAVGLLKMANWLVTNRKIIEGHEKKLKEELDHDVEEWYEKAKDFHESYLDVAEVVDKFLNIPNRGILYELYHYVSDMRGVILITNSYVKWLAMGKPDKETFNGGETEPWVHRGGLLSEFRRFLPMEGLYDLFPLDQKPEINKVYTIRPYLTSDKEAMYEVCLKSYDDCFDGSDLVPLQPQLVGDRFVGAFVEYHPDLCYLVEDDLGSCGYILASDDCSQFHEKLREKWYPKMKKKYQRPDEEVEKFSREEALAEDFYKKPMKTPTMVAEKYPALIQLSFIINRLKDNHTMKRLLNCILTLLQARGAKGVHTCVHVDEINMIGFYLRQGFEDVTEGDIDCNGGDILLFAKPLSV